MYIANGRQRNLSKRLCAAVIVLTGATGVVACGGSQNAADQSISLPAQAKIATPAPREVAAVVDPSASFPRSYLKEGLAILAGAMRAVPGALPETGAFPGRPGVSFSLRIVAGDSFTPAALKISALIPSVPAIDAIKAGSNGDYTQSALDVSAQRKTAKVAFANAERVAGHVADQLQALNLSVTHCSDIQGAVSAAAQSFSNQPNVQHVLIVISDFQQWCAANIAGSLRDVDVLAVMVCQTADECAARERSWDRRFSGARSHQFVRLENAAEMVRYYMTGGAS